MDGFEVKSVSIVYGGWVTPTPAPWQAPKSPEPLCQYVCRWIWPTGPCSCC